MIHIKDLAAESIVNVLEYLRAVDLVSVSEVDKTVFQKSRIQKAVQYQLAMIYANPLATPTKVVRSTSFESPLKMVLSNTSSHNRSPSFDFIVDNPNLGCDVLYVREIRCLSAAISSPQPINGKGFWISASWLYNAKKYFDALVLPELTDTPKKSGTKKQNKIRQRRGSDALPPWPSMNADITCVHGGLALTKGPRAKKRLVDSRVWYFLRKFYPDGPSYKAHSISECKLCLYSDIEAKSIAVEKKQAELKSRQSEFLSGPLQALASRKSGVPSHMLPQKFISEAAWMSMVGESESLGVSSTSSPIGPSSLSSSPIPVEQLPLLPAGTTCLSASYETALLAIDTVHCTQPLLPGLYNLVPRHWLRAWRQYTKDPNVSALPQLDCTTLLCQSHGMLVIPPHLEDYLVGLKKTLLGGLGDYSGDVFEVLSVEEWEDLQTSLKSLSDFSVRFCLDGDSISWNIGVCHVCDPFSYGPYCGHNKEDFTSSGEAKRTFRGSF